MPRVVLDFPDQEAAKEALRAIKREFGWSGKVE